MATPRTRHTQLRPKEEDSITINILIAIATTRTGRTTNTIRLIQRKVTSNAKEIRASSTTIIITIATRLSVIKNNSSSQGMSSRRIRVNRATQRNLSLALRQSTTPRMPAWHHRSDRSIWRTQQALWKTQAPSILPLWRLRLQVRWHLQMLHLLLNLESSG